MSQAKQQGTKRNNPGRERWREERGIKKRQGERGDGQPRVSKPTPGQHLAASFRKRSPRARPAPHTIALLRILLAAGPPKTGHRITLARARTRYLSFWPGWGQTCSLFWRSFSFWCGQPGGGWMLIRGAAASRLGGWAETGPACGHLSLALWSLGIVFGKACAMTISGLPQWRGAVHLPVRAPPPPRSPVEGYC